MPDDVSRAIKSLADLAFVKKIVATTNFTRDADLLRGVDLQLPKLAEHGRGATELTAKASELQIV